VLDYQINLKLITWVPSARGEGNRVWIAFICGFVGQLIQFLCKLA